MKKIAILGLHLNYGGVEEAITQQANMLCERFDVELAIIYKMNEVSPLVINPKVKVTYLTDFKPNRDEFKYSLKHFKLINVLKEGVKAIKILYFKKHSMKEYIKNSDKDIYISSRIEITSLLSKYGKGLKIAEEHRHHNNDKKYIKKLKRATKKIDYLVNVSKGLNDFYSNVLSCKCVHIPNALSFTPINSSKLNNKNIISVGRLSHEKGFLDLIDVFKIVHDIDNEFTLDIIGDGVERNLIINKISEYNLSDAITMHGFQNRKYVNKRLINSSLYVMCSFEESFGIVLIEAASFGVPQIAFSSATGACEIIRNNKTGYLIDNRDKNEMAIKIVELINNKKKLYDMGDNAKTLSNRYSFDNIKEEWFRFLRGA